MLADRAIPSAWTRDNGDSGDNGAAAWSPQYQLSPLSTIVTHLSMKAVTEI
jgi:hypothetical protein